MVKIDLFNLMLAKTKLKRSKDGLTNNEASASEFLVATLSLRLTPNIVNSNNVSWIEHETANH
jgi:hypothetical protein